MKHRPRRSLDRSSRRGMTLVEIMIALLIFSLVFIILIDFWKHGISMNETGLGQVDNLQKTRLLLANFEKDIREASEILAYEDTADYTNIQLKRKSGLFGATEKVVDEFLVYTYYKTKTTLKNAGGVPGEVPCALCKEVYSEAPDKSTKAEKIMIKGVEKARTANTVGILPEVLTSDGKRLKSCIYAYNVHIDPGYQDKDFLSAADKESKLAEARFKSVDTPQGFSDVSQIVAFEIKFLTNDDRNNLNVFSSVAYVRARFYQQIYAQ